MGVKEVIVTSFHQSSTGPNYLGFLCVYVAQVLNLVTVVETLPAFLYRRWLSN